eukprot:3579742-Pleurochrysis_carterae.AAC.14
MNPALRLQSIASWLVPCPLFNAVLQQDGLLGDCVSLLSLSTAASALRGTDARLRASLQVICICNDRQSPKIKSLANHCLDLRFRRPGPKEVAIALRRVAKAEGYDADAPTLEKVAEACNADIRQMLNLLQMWRPRGANLSQADVTSNMVAAFKDVDVGPFDVAHKFFNHANASVESRLRHYFVDSSMTPLLVQARRSATSTGIMHPAKGAQGMQTAELAQVMQHSWERRKGARRRENLRASHHARSTLH